MVLELKVGNCDSGFMGVPLVMPAAPAPSRGAVVFSAKVDCDNALAVSVDPAANALGSLGAGANKPLLNTD